MSLRLPAKQKLMAISVATSSVARLVAAGACGSYDDVSEQRVRFESNLLRTARLIR